MYEEESKETIHIRVLCMMHVWCVYACRTNASFFLSIDYSLGLFFLSSTSMLLYFFFSLAYALLIEASNFTRYPDGMISTVYFKINT